MDILPRLRGILMSSDFSNQFEEFAEDNIEPFVRVLDDGKSPTLEHVEHDHELHDIYRLYLETFEKKIDEAHRRGGLGPRSIHEARAADAGIRQGRRQLAVFSRGFAGNNNAYETFLGLMMTAWLFGSRTSAIQLV